MYPDDEKLLATRFARHPHAAWRALPFGTASNADVGDDQPAGETEVIIVDPVESVSHFLLDDVSAFIWSRMDGSLSVGDLVQEVCSEFDVDTQTARADIIEFVRELISRSLVVEV